MPPATIRPILLVIAAAVAILAACQASPKAPAQTDTIRARTAKQVAAWDRLTTGRVVARSESRFSLIENDTCPGTRVVTSHFEPTSDFLVLLVEDNSQVQCTEGIRSKPVVLVWKDQKYSVPPDTIHVYGSSLSVIGDASTNHPAPLVEGTEEGGMAPSTNTYFSLVNGRMLFSSQFRTLSFAANGTRRYVGVVGGSGDTAAVVSYSTGVAVIQMLRIPRDSDSGSSKDDEFVVDTMDLDGPGRQCCNDILFGVGTKDTVSVSGVTLSFRLSNLGIGGGSTDEHVAYVVQIVNDRLVLAPRTK